VRKRLAVTPFANPRPAYVMGQSPAARYAEQTMLKWRQMTAQPQGPLTLADFVAWELRQENKHEFVEGRIYGFAGGTIEHAAIASAVLTALRSHLRGGPCRAYGSDVMIATEQSSRYADVVVTCDARDHAPKTVTLRYPKLIVEVLSESTAAVDRGEKLDEYRSIGTLEEYVLIDSRKRWAESYRRVNDGWIASLPRAAGKLRLVSVDLTLDLDELYTECSVEVSGSRSSPLSS
jgi:Uma2 family endonuclease